MFVVYGVYLLVKRIQKCREFKQVDQDDSIVPTWSIKIKDIFSPELFCECSHPRYYLCATSGGEHMWYGSQRIISSY